MSADCIFYGFTEEFFFYVLSPRFFSCIFWFLQGFFFLFPFTLCFKKRKCTKNEQLKEQILDIWLICNANQFTFSHVSRDKTKGEIIIVHMNTEALYQYTHRS